MAADKSDAVPPRRKVLSCHKATSIAYLFDVSPTCRLRGQRMLAA